MKNNKVKCQLASFHYKGEAVEITKDVDNFINACQYYYEKYMVRHNKNWKDYLVQLDEMIENRSGFSNDILLKVFCMNIYVLTMMGKLKNDNFNGLNFIYEYERRAA